MRSDTRTSELATALIAQAPQARADAFQRKCGLPIHAYFSALKMRWLLDNIQLVQQDLRTVFFSLYLLI
eukprot:m.809429 g.809429  ORF g.809429 m.809429 type:complete len:69 (-) comp59319_c0_seq23:1684-1890(-)